MKIRLSTIFVLSSWFLVGGALVVRAQQPEVITHRDQAVPVEIPAVVPFEQTGMESH